MWSIKSARWAYKTPDALARCGSNVKTREQLAMIARLWLAARSVFADLAGIVASGYEVVTRNACL